MSFISLYSFNSRHLPQSLPHLLLHRHLLRTAVSDGARIHPDLSQAVVPTGRYQQMQVPAPVELRAIYSCMHIFDEPDTRQHVGAAEEVEIHGVPDSGCGLG